MAWTGNVFIDQMADDFRRLALCPTNWRKFSKAG